MIIFSTIIGLIILFFVLHRLLMNWQIKNAVKHLIDNAEQVIDSPETIAQKEIFKKYREDINKKKYENQSDLLFDLSTFYVMEMLKNETGWTFNKNDFNFKIISNKEIINRLKLKHLSNNHRIYTVKLELIESNELNANNYKFLSSSLDIFNNNL